MATTVRSQPRPAAPPAEDDLVRQLERLWEIPAVAPSRRTWSADAYGVLLRGLVFGWPAFLVVIAMGVPPAPEAATPAWVDAASVGLLLSLLGAGLLFVFPTVALALSGVAGGLGIALGIACKATEHHLGSWWLVETVGFSALAAASVACLALRIRR